MKKKNCNGCAAQTPQVLYPLFEVKDTATSKTLWIIDATRSGAVSKAEIIWSGSGMEVPREILVTDRGTVDYIPALKAAHWEIPIR